MSDVPVRKAEFTPAIERQALRIVMKDPMFVIKWRNRLKPEHFNEPHIQVMFKALDSYVETYNTLPTVESFYQHLKEHIGSYENIQGFYDFASILLAEKDTQVEAHVKDLLMNHMKAVDFDRFAVETARLAGDKEYEKIPKLLHEITIRHTLSVPVTAYLSTPEDSVVARVAAELAQKASLATPWVTFNNKHGGGFHPSAVAAFMGPTGCHAKGQGVLMADGSVKKIEDIKVGDRLMGDGDHKTVLRLCRGKGQMYRIVPTKGDAFIVNDEHILTVECNDKRSSDFGSKVDLSVKDYLSKSRYWKHTHKLIRSDAVVFDNNSRLSIEPYLLGVLLGDGSIKHSTPLVCKPDKELREKIEEIVKTYGCTADFNGEGTGFSLSAGLRGQRKENPLKLLLESLGLHGCGSGDKFIPREYLSASIDDRRKILAGLMDTDGSLQGGCFDYISKSKALSDGVVFIARSLGLAAYTTPCTKGCQSGFKGDYHRVGISGDLSVLPMAIPRKMAKAREQIKSVLHTGFTVEKLGIDDFYGFTLTGNGRYLLDDFTITHNSGKSILLVNAGAHYVLNGKNVYHFTFELSAPKTKARYDVCLTGASHAERKANPSLIDNSMAQLKPRMGKLYVIQISTGTCSANAVRAAINDYVLLGAPKPDVIILDYLTIMMPNNPDDVDMKRDYAKLKQIAEEVRAMAMDLDVPVLTALQSTRGSAGKEKISKEDIADSYAVMHVLDCVLSINQSDAEKQAAKMRLYTAKVRDFEDGYSIVMDIKYDCLRIAEDAITTGNYNKAASKIVEAAMEKKAVAGIHAPLPAVAEMGIEQIVGMGTNPVKTRNNASVETTQADAAKAASWGVGHQPPPIATPG